MKVVKKYYPLITAPVIVMVILLYLFAKYHLYPFGDGTIAWCDMNQQTIPLLMQLKDVLSGKESIFLNMANAGGMNFFGVFFFFLSNPFSLIVFFVPKETLLLFADIIVLLKLYTCAFTAALYFMTCRKKIGGGLTVSFSVMYALCGYGMLFYQNIMWLDIMYWFPILMISLEKLVKEEKNGLYIFSLIICVIMNFYLSYMVAIFILAYMGLYVFSKENNVRIVCAKFLSGTGIAAMITAVIWLCCYLQTARSGRIAFSVEDSKFLTSYMTTLPLLFCTAFLVPVILIHIFSNKNRTPKQNRNIFLFGFMLIPFFIEPVNLMWHTGNYMSFPSRFGFMTIFIGLICCADLFENDNEPFPKNKKVLSLLWLMIPSVLTVFYVHYSQKYIDKNFSALTEYIKTLWGNKESFDGLARLFVFTVLCYTILCILYRKKCIIRPIFSFFILAVCILESVGNVKIYMTAPYQDNPKRTENFQSVIPFCDLLSDDEFYRVADDTGQADYNLLGAMGYNSLGHYTSLINQDYLYTQRRLGYTTVWRKAGSVGGTALTDSLYSVKYRLVKSDDEEYLFEKQPLYLDMGIITDHSLAEELPETLTRAEIQQYLFSEIFSEKQELIQEYSRSNQSKGIIRSDDRYFISDDADIYYNVTVTGLTRLYFDCFNRVSDDLSESYFKSLKIKVNDELLENSYPTSDKNGLLYLGEFQDEKVKIEILANQSITCYSFGVFGLDMNLLKDTLNDSENCHLSYHNGKIDGDYTASESANCLLMIPFSDELKITVNGEKIAYKKVLSDFVEFPLRQGDNHIEIQSIPKGFAIGLTITVAGVILLILYLLFRKRIHLSDKLLLCCQIVTGFISLTILLMVYAFPLIITIL